MYKSTYTMSLLFVACGVQQLSGAADAGRSVSSFPTECPRLTPATAALNIAYLEHSDLARTVVEPRQNRFTTLLPSGELKFSVQHMSVGTIINANPFAPALRADPLWLQMCAFKTGLRELMLDTKDCSKEKAIDSKYPFSTDQSTAEKLKDLIEQNELTVAIACKELPEPSPEAVQFIRALSGLRDATPRTVAVPGQTARGDAHGASSSWCPLQ